MPKCRTVVTSTKAEILHTAIRVQNNRTGMFLAAGWAIIRRMTIAEITLQQARNLMLTTLGLAYRPRHKARKEDVLRAIRQINMCQIDSINIVARAHLNILYSRIGAFDPSWLEGLHREGRLFEYFAHAMCFLPIEDYAVWRGDMLERKVLNKRYREWGDAHADQLDLMRQHLRETGAARSADFENKGNKGLWWDWKIEKDLLEYLFYTGDVMIRERQKFQRVYDLRERVHPDWNDDGLLAEDEAQRRKVMMAARALGVSTPDWIANYFWQKKTPTIKAVRELAAAGDLIPVAVNGMQKLKMYIARENLPLLERAVAGKLTATHSTILSMFDPLVMDRERGRTMFGFDYTIQVYTPAHKRQYGYYVLPVLHRGRLVARADVKAWRKEGRLQVIQLLLEPGVKVSAGLTDGLRTVLQEYAAWQGLTEIEVTRCAPENLRASLSW